MLVFLSGEKSLHCGFLCVRENVIKGALLHVNVTEMVEKAIEREIHSIDRGVGYPRRRRVELDRATLPGMET